MDERYDPNLLLDYVEGELPDDARQRVEALLADDPKLAELVGGMQRDRDALRSAEPGALPRDLVEGALARVERQMLLDDDVAVPSPAVAAPMHRLRIGPLLTYGGIAATLALTATVVFQTLRSETAPSSAPTDNALALADKADGVGLAEAPIQAQRQAAAEESLALGMGRSESAPEAEADLFGGAPAAAEYPADPAYARARGESLDIDSSDSPATVAVPALESVRLSAAEPSATDGFALADAEAPPASAEPRYHVNVFTRSAATTRQEIEDWAFDNRVLIAEESEPLIVPVAYQTRPSDRRTAAKTTPPSASAAPSRLHEASASAPAISAGDMQLRRVSERSQAVQLGQQQLVLTLDQRQVGDLVQVLNSDNLRQNAFVLDNQRSVPPNVPAVAASADPAIAPASPSRAAVADDAPSNRESLALVDRDVVVDEAALIQLDTESPESSGGSELYLYFDRNRAAESAERNAGVSGRYDSPAIENNQNLFFYTQPAPSVPVPWVQRFLPPEPVRVRVVIEEAPAALVPPFRGASPPATPAEPR